MAITAVGSLSTTTGSNNTTFTVTTTALGNLVVVGSRTNSLSQTITGISGGGCSWVAGGTAFVSNARGRTYEVWLGTVTSVVSGSTATVSWSADPSTKTQSYSPQEFTNGTGAATTWASVGSQYIGIENSASATTMNWPTLTASNTNRLYFGKGSNTTGTPTATGTPAGFAFVASVDMWCYGVVGPGAVSPTQDCDSATTSAAVAALIVPTGTAVPPPPPTFMSQYSSYH